MDAKKELQAKLMQIVKPLTLSTNNPWIIQETGGFNKMILTSKPRQVEMKINPNIKEALDNDISIEDDNVQELLGSIANFSSVFEQFINKDIIPVIVGAKDSTGAISEVMSKIGTPVDLVAINTIATSASWLKTIDFCCTHYGLNQEYKSILLEMLRNKSNGKKIDSR